MTFNQIGRATTSILYTFDGQLMLRAQLYESIGVSLGDIARRYQDADRASVGFNFCYNQEGIEERRIIVNGFGTDTFLLTGDLPGEYTVSIDNGCGGWPLLDR